MNELYLIISVVTYFILGIGVFNLWKKTVGDEYMFFVVFAWPLVLLVTSMLERKD